MALLYSVTSRDDPKEKFGSIIDAVKKAIPGMGGAESQVDEIQKILEDEDTKGALSEMLELIMSTRLVSACR
jgi:hypothetical protein